MSVSGKQSKLSKVKSLMREHKRSFIILIPEEHDDAPHFLFWLLLILVFIFLISWLWVNWSGSAALMSYLSYR